MEDMTAKESAEKKPAARKTTGKKKAEAENLEALSMDEAYARLDALLNEMESGNHTLEESFALYSRGVSLVQACHEKIDRIEKQLIVLEEKRGEEA